MHNWVTLLFFVCVWVLGSFSAANAVEPDEILTDSVLEDRARGLSAELRCLVCQNQSIDDSDAPLAKDLRVLVRERLVAGDSDGQVMEYIVGRYGEFVLLKPKFAWHTVFLWATPIAALLLGLFGFFRFTKFREAKSVTGMALSAEEEKAINKLLDDRE